MFNADLNTLITINNGTIDISSLSKEIRLEPFVYFGVSKKGPFVVLAGDKMKTCFLGKRQSGKYRENNLYVTEEKEGNMSSVKMLSIEKNLPLGYFCLYSDFYQKRGFYTLHKIVYSLYARLVKNFVFPFHSGYYRVAKCCNCIF